jgi:uncharacterized protein
VKLEHSFEVTAPPDEVWEYLLNVERVAPCMPGAELTDIVDETTWKGKVNVKLGAVNLTYRGKVEIAEQDDVAHRVVLKATGQEMRGKGTASATVTSALEPVGDGTRVDITTDMTLSGAAAQYGRGMIGDVSRKLTDQFADCLREQLEPAPEPPPPGDAATPERRLAPRPRQVKGGRLALWAVGQALLRLVRRLGRAFAAAGRAFRSEMREDHDG